MWILSDIVADAVYSGNKWSIFSASFTGHDSQANNRMNRLGMLIRLEMAGVYFE